MEQGTAMANVGTPENPVSFLHERTVALLWEELQSAPEVRVRYTPGGELSHDLLKGVAHTKVPGEWDQVGGVVPDLILQNDDHEPVRIIEVVVSNPPDARKREKLDSLKRRGIDVIEVTVYKLDDLFSLCWSPAVPKYSALRSSDRFSVNLARNEFESRNKMKSDRQVEELGAALLRCSPDTRRWFWNVLHHLDDLDALFPIRPNNPKANAVGRNDGGTQ